MIILLNTALDLKIFSPSEPKGIFIIFVGLIFTGMIFYIIYSVSINKESLEYKKKSNQKRILTTPINQYLINNIVFKNYLFNYIF